MYTYIHESNDCTSAYNLTSWSANRASRPFPPRPAPLPINEPKRLVQEVRPTEHRCPTNELSEDASCPVVTVTGHWAERWRA